MKNKSVLFFSIFHTRKKLLDLCSITVIMKEGTPSFHGMENLVPYIEIMAGLGSKEGISIKDTDLNVNGKAREGRFQA